MSELRIQSLVMPVARLGPENPLPALFNIREPFQFKTLSGIPVEIGANIGYGHLATIAPYTFQDGYNRNLHETSLKVAVLENDILKATFLLEYGGRLWSLYHKPARQELLEVNSVLQLANLAIRNAWFSGGAEWNIGALGHSPFTCSPIFCAHLERSDGTPILRFYEWERFRQVTFQMDIFLPDGSPVLFIIVSIYNPNQHDVPMYWWSNIALPFKKETRVISPSHYAYCLGCRNSGFIRIPIPNHNEVDITYPSNVRHAADYFFHILPGKVPWITALDSKGAGLFHISTSKLMGRKLWDWGSGTGGRNWQEFLSPGGKGYIEIQAGITRTQLEHLRMPAGESLTWLEALGSVQTQSEIVHGSDWDGAIAEVEGKILELIPQSRMVHEFRLGISSKNKPPLKILQHGSGWGALEKKRREKMGETKMCETGLIFDEKSLDEAQAPWISLLNNGYCEINEPGSLPVGYVVSESWHKLLKQSLASGQNENWFAWFHLGVIRYNNGDIEGAQLSWKHSCTLKWTPWAARCLGRAAFNEGRHKEAVECMVAAHKDQPELLPLAIECGHCMVDAGQYIQFLELFDGMPSCIRFNGRMRLIQAQAALNAGDFVIVEKFFHDQVVVDDLREGEQTLSELWVSFHVQKTCRNNGIAVNNKLRSQVLEEFPLPPELDFRLDT